MPETVTSSAIEAVYRCPDCKSEYKTAPEAEACSATPPWPSGTKIAVRGGIGWATSELWQVRSVESRGGVECKTFTSMDPHPLFRGRHCHQGGVCLVGKKVAHEEPGVCQYRPLTPELAAEAAGELEKWAKAKRKEATTYEKRATFLRTFVSQSSAALSPVPTPQEEERQAP